MAAAVDSQGLNIDPKEFECSICLELLEDPRTLPCGHWFCGPTKDCLAGQTFTTGDIECAICRKVHKNIVVRDLPPNYSIRSILEALRNQSGLPNTPVTPENTNLLDFDNSKIECSRHRGNLLSYYCEDCTRTLCQQCWADTHSEHKVILVQQKRKKMLLDLLESFGFDDVVKHYKKLLEDNNKRKAILRDLVKHADRLNSFLTSRSQEVETLQNMADDLTNKSASCDEKFCKDLMEKLTKEMDGGEDPQIKTSFQTFKSESESKYLSLMNTFVSSEKAMTEHASVESADGAVRKKTNRRKKGPQDRSSLEQDLKSAIKDKSTSKAEDANNNKASNDKPGTSRAAPVSAMFLSSDAGHSEDEFEDEGECDGDDVSESGSAVSASVQSSVDCNRGSSSGGNRNRRGKRGGNPGKPRSAVGGVRAPGPRGGPPRPPRGGTHFNAASPRGPHAPNPGFPRMPQMPPPVAVPLIPPNLLGAPNFPAPGTRVAPGFVPRPVPPRPPFMAPPPIRVNGILVFRRGNMLDAPHSLAIGVREGCEFDSGLPQALGRRFKPIPEMFKKAKKRPGQIFVFDDHRMNPTRFIYCLVIKEQNWMGKPYSAVLENCFHAMKDHAVGKNVTDISMPLIGHAHGDDLSVDLVELILKNIFSPANITLNIYS